VSFLIGIVIYAIKEKITQAGCLSFLSILHPEWPPVLEYPGDKAVSVYGFIQNYYCVHYYPASGSCHNQCNEGCSLRRYCVKHVQTHEAVFVAAAVGVGVAIALSVVCVGFN